MSNRGRISFSRGPVESIILVIGKYVDFLRKIDGFYEFKQSIKITENEITFRNIGEILYLKMPSLNKIRGTVSDRNSAIVSMLTSGEGEFGYIGIPIGSDRVSILDLKERKNLQVTINGDEVYVYSENPSEARSAIRRLISEMASHIDPDIEVHKIVPGGS